MTAERRATVLIVDDDAKLLKLLAILVERAGFDAVTVTSGHAAILECYRAQPDVVMTDVRMDGMSGMTLFDVLRERYPTLPVIILTAHGTIPDAVIATQSGVFAYMTKPFDSEELLVTLRRALARRGRTSDGGTPEAAASLDEWCPEIVTINPAMRALLDQAKRFARTDSNVLLQGPSGTGKEVLAKAMHRASRRNRGPFVPVNCTAIPEGLFESEFFGHRKGAFTGASETREGLLAMAQGGTLLLDEIGDMPAQFQAKLLRVLQEREMRPVGANVAVPVDLRIISATHQDLEGAVARREFREDLYYRLNVVTLEIPPLTARTEDVALLAERFVSEMQRHDAAPAVRGFAPDALETLMSASWPGNVRQLRNVVEHCLVLSSGPLISADLVKRALRGKIRKLVPLTEARDRFEFDYLMQLLQATKGNVTQAARLADRNRSEFYSLLKKHRLDPDSFREA